MTKEKYWEDFKIGEEFTTAAITITETHMVNWAGLTMDYYPLHVDEEYGKKTMFKGRVPHGPLMFALAIGLVGMTGIYGNSLLAWLGAENMKMVAPVKLGDTIRVHGKVKEKRETKDPLRGVIKFYWEIKNQNNENVLILDWVLMHHRRP